MPQLSLPNLCTERLILIPLAHDHLEFEIALDADPQVIKYIFKHPRTEDEVRSGHQRRMAIPRASPGLGFWVTYLNTSPSEPIGLFLLEPPKRDDQFQAGISRDKTAEIGYRLASNSWGQGYAAEGARELLRYGFQDLGLERVFGETMAVNAGSRKTMEKIGMKAVRTFHLDLAEVEKIEGTEKGEIEYAILREEWE